MNRSISSGAHEFVDRTVDHQGEQRISVANTPATIFAILSVTGIAEQIVQVLKGKAQQAQKRLASLAVARSAQDMDPAEQQQVFIIRQDRAAR